MSVCTRASGNAVVRPWPAPVFCAQRTAIFSALHDPEKINPQHMLFLHACLSAPACMCNQSLWRLKHGLLGACCTRHSVWRHRRHTDALAGTGGSSFCLRCGIFASSRPRHRVPRWSGKQRGGPNSHLQQELHVPLSRAAVGIVSVCSFDQGGAPPRGEAYPTKALRGPPLHP